MADLISGFWSDGSDSRSITLLFDSSKSGTACNIFSCSLGFQILSDHHSPDRHNPLGREKSMSGNLNWSGEEKRLLQERVTAKPGDERQEYDYWYDIAGPF